MIHTPIVPEPVNEETPNYLPGHWDYPTRCADLALALAVTRERIEEWDRAEDPSGWWHERPKLIAMYNAIVSQMSS